MSNSYETFSIGWVIQINTEFLKTLGCAGILLAIWIIPILFSIALVVTLVREIYRSLLRLTGNKTMAIFITAGIYLVHVFITIIVAEVLSADNLIWLPTVSFLGVAGVIILAARPKDE